MCQLREKTDHLIVFLHAEGGDVMKLQDLRQLSGSLHRFHRVLFGRYDDVVCVMEHFRVGIFDAAGLPSGHRMSGDELHVIAQERLHLVRHVDLDAADVR